MTKARLQHLHRLAEIFYRRMYCGDSIAKLAAAYDISESYVYTELARASSNADIKAAAEKLSLSRQMSFDFGS